MSLCIHQIMLNRPTVIILVWDVLSKRNNLCYYIVFLEIAVPLLMLSTYNRIVFSHLMLLCPSYARTEIFRMTAALRLSWHAGLFAKQIISAVVRRHVWYRLRATKNVKTAKGRMITHELKRNCHSSRRVPCEDRRR